MLHIAGNSLSVDSLLFLVLALSSRGFMHMRYIHAQGMGKRCSGETWEGGKDVKEEREVVSAPKAEILTSRGSCSKGSLLTVI